MHELCGSPSLVAQQTFQVGVQPPDVEQLLGPVGHVVTDARPTLRVTMVRTAGLVQRGVHEVVAHLHPDSVHVDDGGVGSALRPNSRTTTRPR